MIDILRLNESADQIAQSYKTVLLNSNDGLPPLPKSTGRPSWRSKLARTFTMLAPVYDTVPRSIVPYTTLFLIATNIFIYGLILFLQIDGSDVFERLALVPVRFSEYRAHMSVWTSLFLHLGFWHLVVDVFFLWTFGDNVEEVLGAARYFLMYLLSGIGANLTYTILYPSSTVPLIGASAAISAVIGSYFVLFKDFSMRIVFWNWIVELPGWLFLAVWFWLQILFFSMCTDFSYREFPWELYLFGFAFGASITLAGIKTGIFKRPRLALQIKSTI